MGEQVSLVNARLGGRASTRAARCSLSLRGTAPLPLCGNVAARASREIALSLIHISEPTRPY